MQSNCLSHSIDDKSCLSLNKMVRHQVKFISEGIEPETKNRGRHSISHPPDNIGVSCTVQSNDSEERILPGRRRSLAVPRDNIGVACLPMTDKLDNILELPEYESSDEEIEKKTTVKFSHNRRSPLPQATVRARSRMNSTRDEIVGANETTTSSNESALIGNVNTRFERGRSCKRRDTVGLLWQETGKETFKKHGESRTSDHNKFQGEIGMSNVRRPKDDPTKPRKPILPRDNIGFACKPLHKPAGRLNGSRLNAGVNYKNTSNPVEKKNFLRAKLTTENVRNERTTREQVDTLRTVSKLSVLLLYIHFLLTYYLSFAKSHRYGEIFDSCPPQDVYE